MDSTKCSGSTLNSNATTGWRPFAFRLISSSSNWTRAYDKDKDEIFRTTSSTHTVDTVTGQVNSTSRTYRFFPFSSPHNHHFLRCRRQRTQLCTLRMPKKCFSSRDNLPCGFKVGRRRFKITARSLTAPKREQSDLAIQGEENYSSQVPRRRG